MDQHHIPYHTIQEFLSRPKKTHAYKKKVISTDSSSDGGVKKDKDKKDKDTDGQVLIVDPGMIL